MKSYRSEIERLTPYLRQFARALVAFDRPDIADELVHDASPRPCGTIRAPPPRKSMAG